MSHLKCTLHERRVIVSEGKAIHRSTTAGDLSASCDSTTVLSGASFYSVTSKVFTSTAWPKVKISGNPETDAVVTLQNAAKSSRKRTKR